MAISAVNSMLLKLFNIKTIINTVKAGKSLIATGLMQIPFTFDPRQYEFNVIKETFGG